MYFKDLKTGYVVYIFTKDSIDVKQGKVISVSLPHFDKNTFGNAKMVVDVTVDTDGHNRTYTLREDTDTGYTDSSVISTDKLNIIREVEMSKSQSEEILNQVEEHTKRIQKYNQILAEFNPAIKEKQAIDERFGKLESSINELKDMLSNVTIQHV